MDHVNKRPFAFLRILGKPIDSKDREVTKPYDCSQDPMV